MAGGLYIWFMVGVFVVVVGVIGVFGILLYAGHWMEKRRTGSKAGFLELPEELRSRPAPPSSSMPAEGEGEKR